MKILHREDQFPPSPLLESALIPIDLISKINYLYGRRGIKVLIRSIPSKEEMNDNSS